MPRPATPRRDVSNYARLFQILAGCRAEAIPVEKVHRRLARFEASHPCDMKHIESVVNGISRARKLFESAEKWEAPSIGKKSKPTRADEVRGEQWRLVMAFAGFENLLHVLRHTRENDRWISRSRIEQIVDVASPPEYATPIESPSGKRAELRRWLSEEGDETDGELLFQFLRLNGTAKQTLTRWLIVEQPISSWSEAMLLAQSFRHATAHGALSPTKILSFGLRPAFNRLTVDIGQLIDSAIGAIVSLEDD